jgi:hypothetical protein
VTTAQGKTPKPPFGLRAWDPVAPAVAVLLDVRGHSACTTADVAGQLPVAASLPPGTPVLVLGNAANDGALWRLFARGVPVPRGARCSALIARGYVDVGAGVDEVSGADLVWGSAPAEL